MRAIHLAIISISIAASVVPSYALQANDTMKAWKGASAKDRADLLGQILGQSAVNPSVVKCLDETSNLSGHTDLAISEVAKFCASAKGTAEPI